MTKPRRTGEGAKRPKAHVSDYKKKTVDAIVKDVLEYPIIGAINMENLPAAQLQTMMKMLRGKIKIAMTKRRLLKIVIEKTKDKKKGIEKLEPHLKGMPALLLTKENPFTLFKILKQNKSPAPAKPGQKAPKDIIVPAGGTPFAPGPVIGELSQLGIKSGVENGKIIIKQDAVIVREGKEISEKAAAMLTRLNIMPMEVGLDVVAVYENGEILTKSILDVNEEEYLQKLGTAGRWAFNLAIEAGYPCNETIKFLIGKAYNDSKALALAQGIPADKVVDALLAKAEREANAVKSAGNL